jgi:hypothetical protein
LEIGFVRCGITTRLLDTNLSAVVPKIKKNPKVPLRADAAYLLGLSSLSSEKAIPFL